MTKVNNNFHNLKALVNEFNNWNDICKIKTEERKGCAGC